MWFRSVYVWDWVTLWGHEIETVNWFVVYEESQPGLQLALSINFHGGLLSCMLSAVYRMTIPEMFQTSNG